MAQYDDQSRCLAKVTWRQPDECAAFDTHLWSRRYTYSAEGDLLRVKDSREGVTRYDYDAAHRLVLDTQARYSGVRALDVVTDLLEATPVPA